MAAVTITSQQQTTLTTPVASLLAIAVAANKIYGVRFYGAVENSSGGWRIGLNGPADAVLDGWVESSGNLALTSLARGEVTTINALVTTSAAAAGGRGYGRMWARVKTTTAGTLTLAFGSITNGVTTTLHAGCMFVVEEIVEA